MQSSLYRCRPSRRRIGGLRVLLVVWASLYVPRVRSYEFVGCYVDKWTRALDGAEYRVTDLTIAACDELCAGYTHFGVQYRQECFCGDGGFDVYGVATNCELPCAGDAGEVCGGGWANSVYTTTPGGAEEEPSGNTEDMGPEYIGCYRDTAVRALTGDFQTFPQTLTVEVCNDFCQGFSYFGLQYKYECFCGDVVEDHGSSSNCDKPCSGDGTETCGGAWALSLFKTFNELVGFDAPLIYLGCYKDYPEARRLSSEAHVLQELTPEACAIRCQGFAFFGLQYSTECFCGDSYNSDDPADNCNRPCAGDSSEMCGGAWANSVYRTGVEPANTPAPTPANVEETRPRRQFTIVNECDDMIRVGSTGGWVKDAIDEDGCPDGSWFDSNVGSCFWSLPAPEDGASFEVASGDQIVVKLDHEPWGSIRWTGNIWASTGCQVAAGCETGFCYNNPSGFPNGHCPPSTGPRGPVTVAEFALVDTGADYYDISIIGGVNLPIEVRPDPLSFPSEVVGDTSYWCSNAGGSTPMHAGASVAGCPWTFDASDVLGMGDMRRFLRWVLNDGNNPSCEDDADCADPTHRCGTMYGRNLYDGGPTDDLFPGVCGRPLGWTTARGACSVSTVWPNGYFPNAYPFYCDTQTGQGEEEDAADTTLSRLYGCAGKLYGQSGYSSEEPTACGCPDWGAHGIVAPSAAPCTSNNPVWEEFSLPWLVFLKTGCPTAYSFPYDDHSSTFVCRNQDNLGVEDGEEQNTASYILTFCKDGSQASVLA